MKVATEQESINLIHTKRDIDQIWEKNSDCKKWQAVELDADRNHGTKGSSAQWRKREQKLPSRVFLACSSCLLI